MFIWILLLCLLLLGGCSYISIEYSEQLAIFYEDIVIWFKQQKNKITKWIKNNKKKLIGGIVAISMASAGVMLIPVGDEPFSNTDNLGYELLDNGTVFHMWNNHDSYYFNRSNGIQFSNHYQEFWTTNVLMLGYYSGDTWNLLYRTDKLSGFNEVLNCVTEDYINATLWKDLSYGAYDFRLALRYHLRVNDSDLTIIPYIKNLGIAIPFDIGFGWEIKDIRIANVTNDNYLWIGNNTIHEKILLNQTLDKNWNDLENNTKINLVCTNPPSPYLSRNLYLIWDKNLTYRVTCKSRANQYNAPTTLFIKVGTLAVGQEKYTEMNWLDADDWLGISSSNLVADSGSYFEGWEDLDDALDGNTHWKSANDDTPQWFILDLEQTYTITKFRGRSIDSVGDPIDVDIYISTNNSTWGTAVATGITTWQDTASWIEVDSTDKVGRYIKVEIIDWEFRKYGGFNLVWGKTNFPYITIFDAYGDIAITNTAPTQSGESPTNTSTDIAVTPSLYVICLDDDADNMNATWYSNSSGSWVQFASNGTIANNTNITQPNSNFSAYSTTYYWSVNLTDDNGGWNNETYHFTTLDATIYNTTIRNDGIDYFVWLGTNTTASVVDDDIVGFDELAEYMSIWRNGTWGGTAIGNWVTYYGDESGTDFSIYTYDVIKIYLTDSDTQLINMTSNTDITYSNSRAVTLLNDSVTLGGNYTGYTNTTSTTLGDIATAAGLDSGEYLNLWNETTFTWNFYIVGFYEPVVAVHEDDVIFTKVEDTESWAISGK